MTWQIKNKMCDNGPLSGTSVFIGNDTRCDVQILLRWKFKILLTFSIKTFLKCKTICNLLLYSIHNLPLHPLQTSTKWKRGAPKSEEAEKREFISNSG